MKDKEQRSGPFRLKVWGRNACFTRPEMKVERVSYDVMTPSAARGVLGLKNLRCFFLAYRAAKACAASAERKAPR